MAPMAAPLGQGEIDRRARFWYLPCLIVEKGRSRAGRIAAQRLYFLLKLEDGPWYRYSCAIITSIRR
jgi:hypothetical protein